MLEAPFELAEAPPKRNLARGAAQQRHARDAAHADRAERRPRREAAGGHREAGGDADAPSVAGATAQSRQAQMESIAIAERQRHSSDRGGWMSGGGGGAVWEGIIPATPTGQVCNTVQHNPHSEFP